MNLPHATEGTALRDRRTAAGLTQAELADQAGIAQSYLSRVELGWHQPGDDVRQRLTTALDAAEARSGAVA